VSHFVFRYVAPAAISLARNVDGAEALVDFLEEGESATLAEGTYFYFTE